MKTNQQNFFIGLRGKPLVIAEMSGNHNGKLERALELVDAAGKAGAHCLKLQTYTADTMTLPLRTKEFVISDPKSLWNGRSLHDLYNEAHTPWEWHKPIFDRARELGMLAMSTPFDESAVDFLMGLGVPFFKIASFELTDIPLIKKVASTGKPMIMSCGMATLGEIDAAVRTARNAGCKDLVLLKCTSSYPASPENSNLLTIPVMRDAFGCEVGISDHTMGVGVSVAAVALGATVIEKHFTLDRSEGGVDSAFSLEPEELRSLVVESERAWLALGHAFFGPSEPEKNSFQFRRSIYVSKDIKKGETLTEQNIKRIRPGFGLAPAQYEDAIGSVASNDLVAGNPLKLGDFVQS